MNKPALRRATKSTVLFVIATLLFVAGLAGTTFGYFDGETDNVGTWSGGYVFAPTLATTLGAVTGPVQTLTWATPTTTGIQNYELRVTNMGSSAVACPAQSVVTTLAATVTQPVTYPETVGTLAAPSLSGLATIPSTDNGYFVCYQVAANWTPSTWYSQASNANATAVRAGLWPTAVVATNISGNNALANTDYLTITYNQNVNASGTARVCAFHVGTGTGVVIFGDQNNCASVNDSYSIGKITGVSIGTTRNYATSSISKPAANQVRITLSGGAGNSSYAGTDTWINGGTAVTSVGGTPNLSPCTQTNCNVAVTGGF